MVLVLRVMLGGEKIENQYKKLIISNFSTAKILKIEAKVKGSCRSPNNV